MDAVYIYYYEGYTAVEIDRILRKNKNTVYTLLTHSKRLLKEKLGVKIMKRRLQDAFDKIHAEQDLKDRTMEFLQTAAKRYKKGRTVPPKQLIAVAACFVLLLFARMGYSAYLTPAFAISIGINPSIELGINRFNKVVSVDAYNENGHTVMYAVNVDYLNCRDALDQILADKGMEEYIVQDQLISITVFRGDEEQSNELLDNVTARTTCYLPVLPAISKKSPQHMKPECHLKNIRHF